MATHSSVLAWRIPGMGEPGGLLSLGSHRVGHDWSDLAAAAAESHKGFSGGPTVNNPPAVQELRIPFPGQEDPLEKTRATLSSILAWEMPWTGDSGGLQSTGSQEMQTTWQLNYHQDLILRMPLSTQYLTIIFHRMCAFFQWALQNIFCFTVNMRVSLSRMNTGWCLYVLLLLR